MKWHFESDRPIYTQLVELIEQAVATGMYEPGQRLPGVRELASAAGVNPNTMQRALAELETQGLLFTQRTSGRFVTDDAARIAKLREHLATDVTLRYTQKMHTLGYTAAETLTFVKNAAQ